MKKSIIITFSAIGFHQYPNAPQEVSFLRHMHRHLFTFKIGIPVSDSNREREFFIEQSRAKTAANDLLVESSRSCEMLAEAILEALPQASWCEVWEDRENGARVER